ncbi:TlpA family protein disulfide reductase [Sphingobacterium luzhongxinii]|uniref:TlpA family protein disulfide reductase n=1 Tax=Sphingobacterium luzhongxinii TaxID=2654181 RepID=UPI0013DD5EBB|nr:TlpA disulfide reductase family protein [Sphingobacterium sp. xlx-73]
MNYFFGGGHLLPYRQLFNAPTISLISSYVLHRVRLLRCRRNDDMGKWRSLLANSHKLSAMITIYCVLFSGLSVSPASGQETEDLNKIVPLKVGDTIPEQLWNMPLRVLNHPEGKQHIRLSDYRDKKLIILDFWATWCSSCITAFPAIKQLQNRFDKDILFISVTNQKADIVADFILKNEKAKEVNLWSVVEADVMDQAIVKYTVPHFTWMAGGRIVSNSSRSAIKEEYIKAYLETKKIGWGEKVNLNTSEPFYNSVGDLPSSTTSFYYEGQLDGAGSGFGMMPYKAGLTSYYFINFPQRKIYEWFINRLARAAGKNLSEISYTPAFVSSPDWKIFNERPVSMQIIAKSDKALKDIFSQFLALSSIPVHPDKNSVHPCIINDKEVSQ